MAYSCKGCGDEFSPERKSSLYCHRLRTLKCANCAELFSRQCKRSIPKYCSKDCRSYHSTAELLRSTALWEELHPTKNSSILTEQLRINSSIEVWWTKENCGHEWSARVKNRFAPHYGQCPFCSNQRVLSGFNDLATLRPDLLSQWDYELNAEDPSLVASQSNKTFWWRCDNHQSYLLQANKKFHRPSCPICSNRRLLSGFNDLATRYPAKAIEWSTKNKKGAHEVFPGTLVKYLWECRAGHEFLMAPIKKCLDDRGCPICSNQVVMPGINDFATTHPHLLERLSSTNRKDHTTFSYGTKQVLEWDCSICSHSYKSSVLEQSKKSISLCRPCGKKESFLEATVEIFLRDKAILYKRKTKPIRHNGRRLELDFFLPEQNIAFEIQDFATHSKTSNDEPLTEFWKKRSPENPLKRGPVYHEQKRKLAKEQLDITLVDIWEDEVRSGYFMEIIDNLLRDE